MAQLHCSLASLQRSFYPTVEMLVHLCSYCPTLFTGARNGISLHVHQLMNASGKWGYIHKRILIGPQEKGKYEHVRKMEILDWTK